MNELNIDRDGLIATFAGRLWWRIGNKFRHLGDIHDIKKIEAILSEMIVGEMIVRDKWSRMSAYDLHLAVKGNEGAIGNNNSMKVVVYEGKFVIPMSEKMVPLDEFIIKNKDDIKYLRFFKPGSKSVLMENPFTGRTYNYRGIIVRDSFRDKNSFVSEIQMRDKFDKLKHNERQKELYKEN